MTSCLKYGLLLKCVKEFRLFKLCLLLYEKNARGEGAGEGVGAGANTVLIFQEFNSNEKEIRK